ncbi:hypothetical protein GCM10009789_29120 [Kribbella sancticallisti]|uniref:ANTAR domain-containing protein n=1 Tax=Kribbella sancticallisti TaxID=460087 RepID=A0ABN2DD32_9ACTN
MAESVVSDAWQGSVTDEQSEAVRLIARQLEVDEDTASLILDCS